MKKTPLTINRGKPPSVRTPLYLSSKTRSHLNERQSYLLPSFQLGPERLISMSESPEICEPREYIHQHQFTSKEVSDCMSNWLTFLKVLQTLCATGSDLVDSLNALSNGTNMCKTRVDHCKAMWEHLINATNTAASIIRNQTIASLQEAHVAPDIDSDQAETNQAVVCSGLLRLLNLQYQFCVTTCDWAYTQPSCGCALSTGEHEAVARCFVPRQPMTAAPPQRRWSEVTSQADRGPPEVRRWSIPWKLALPTAPGGDQRSRSTTPDAVWHTALANQDDLQDVISLLSCQPANVNPPHTPGVVLTRPEGHGLDNSGKIISHRGSWWGDSDELDVNTLTSRKSSSSTDSSSCYSHMCHSSSDELSHRGQYSMWSGNDLPFIKLPESSEHNDN
ncbi:uncharacterized protein [Halyomorpha halys]|uniref:uncharacterized protein n=1 Tax=Halyomorpha halys TaxID=286706 RepID=UPI0006D4D65D|nr:uncharacterized protein LOC106688391 [Halyomorpha halys]